MNPGGLSQMSSNSFASHNGFGNPGGLASRRGGQGVKPLSFDGVAKSADKENTIPTPRTSRSHLLAGLRTAPKSATASSFGPASPTTADPTQQYARGNIAANVHAVGHDNVYNAPKTALPQYASHSHLQRHQQHHMLQQQQGGNGLVGQQYTVDQVLAPPELAFDDQVQEQMDPSIYAQLVATNIYLAQQQQRLQQQLRSIQAAAQQFQQLNLSNPQLAQQQMAIYEQQQQLRNMQQQLGAQASQGLQQQQQQQQQPQQPQQQQQFYYNPMTGQYYVDTSTASQMGSSLSEQPMTPSSYGSYQQFQQHQQQSGLQGQVQTPRVQVSPPPESFSQGVSFRSNSPSKRAESPQEHEPLPPPSANAFRRGHKKAPSLAPVNAALAASFGSSGQPTSAGPKSATFPATPLTGGYGPGQARAGEHPVRQPRGPPSLDELKMKPTARHEGSKNFATRTRRSAVHNLVRAGLERRKGTGSSSGSISPVSETEESTTPITDNDSESGRSGSGSLVGEEERSSVRKPNGGGWGAIGSERPNSSQQARKPSEGEALGSETEPDSFARLFKSDAQRASKAQEAADAQRRAPRLVLTNSDKRKTTALA